MIIQNQDATKIFPSQAERTSRLRKNHKTKYDVVEDSVFKKLNSIYRRIILCALLFIPIDNIAI